MRKKNELDKTHTNSKHGTNTENDLRSVAEALIIEEDKNKNKALDKLSLEETDSIVHELKVYQIELEMQNDELRRTQSELEITKARYFDIYDLAPEGYLILSEKGLIIESNLTAAVMFGESKYSLAKKRISEYIYKEDQDVYYTYRKKLYDTKLPHECELRMLKSDQTVFWGHMKSIVVEEGGLNNCRMVISDISPRKTAENDLKESEEKLQYLSTHDHLTGLYNRRYYEQQLKELDTKENLPLSIIMFDLNGLKLVNDSFGHDMGDVLLKKAGETIKKACRYEDIIARIGGDEFVLMLPKTSRRDTIKIANHIKELTSKEIVSNIELSISYGYDTKEMEDQSISEIAVNAENHMYKHKLFERTSIRSKTIELIMNTLFEKSNSEELHSNRVSNICQAIAVEMDLDQNTVNQMRVVGLMHDIGKIGVDEEILNKAESLTSSERVDIEKHPEIGWRLLSSTNEFSEIAQFVIHHHEKWDGTGYPDGIKGEAIQIEARIIAVAEAYAAMTSERNFDKKLSKKEALRELVRCSGTHFDPTVVEVFNELVLSGNNNY
ncbi:MAG: c-di-GMP phosphodiesterase [Firmicutes bacterium HGW-Firmicutes-2]|jgi:diguanylate cyclase (GGDEF)-like protein/PAS domain S-box-containing protein/putative nucleotidyltransferase with HDIG domain|nr:MAG: c-di-GMP phosphodiesterase [Firmicutes bacterium HGW-Firmicutes-2]